MKAIWTKNNRRTKKNWKAETKTNQQWKKKIRTQKKNLRSQQIFSFRSVVCRGEGTN